MYIFLFFCIALLSSVYRRIKGVRVAAFSCGLFGLAANKPVTPLMLEKLKALGLFNQNRGKDSCGYFNGENIFKGVDSEKEFFEYIVKNGIQEGSNGNNIFICHTRASTYGASTVENAHPFKINDELILAHNGTIDNIWSLCTQHGIPIKDIHVDSLGLGCILEKDGPGVLGEYEGAAALLMHKISEPNVMWVYHGAAKNYEEYAEIEERPLFWMNTADGVYMSSLKNALEFIRNKATDEEPKQVPHNQVIRIENGVISKDMPYFVNRGTCNIKKTYSYSPPAKVTPSVTNSHVGNTMPSEAKYIINDEITPSHAFNDPNIMYFYKGRYWIGDKVCHGEFICHNKTGMRGESVSDFSRHLQLNCIEGVWIETVENYQLLKKAWDEKNTLYSTLKNGHNFAKLISTYSKYPVSNLPTDNCTYPANRYFWHKDGVLCSCAALTPKLSDRTYHIRNGNIIRYSSDTSKRIFFSEKIEDIKVNDENDDIKGIAERFDKVWTSVDTITEDLGDFAMQALELYADDLITNVYLDFITAPLNMAIVKDILGWAVVKAVPIRELLHPEQEDIEHYIAQALEDDSNNAPLTDAEQKQLMRDYKRENEEVIDNQAKKEQAAESVRRLNAANALSQQKLFNDAAQIDYDAGLEEDEQNEEAVEKLHRLLKDVAELRESFGVFETLDKSSLAQKVFNDGQISISLMLDNLKENFQDARQTKAVLKIKEYIK